jgi:hypothetical protein
VSKLRRGAAERGSDRKKASAARQAWHSIFELAFLSPDSHVRMSGICERSGFTPGLLKALISPSLQSPDPVPMRDLA